MTDSNLKFQVRKKWLNNLNYRTHLKKASDSKSNVIIKFRRKLVTSMHKGSYQPLSFMQAKGQ